MDRTPPLRVPVRPAALRLGLVVAAVGVVAASGWWVAAQPADAVPPPVVEVTPSAPPPPLGKAGCSATACHGGPADLSTSPADGCWQGSATRWQAADPHTRAFATLEGTKAGEIMAGLGWKTKATAEARCLACHTTPALATHGSVELRKEGVSCAGCHGDPTPWLTTHTRGGRTPGMTPLFNVGERAKACAGCHVGAPAADGIPVRDMNHDMIAAGHPRLTFDFAEHHRRLPKHWHEDTPPKESHLWLVGRIAHAEAACELLASRAERQATDERTPWPEFSEYNCAACHHPVPGDSTRTAGRLRWQLVWPLTSTGWAGLGAVKTAMQRKQTDPADVKLKATTASELLATVYTNPPVGLRPLPGGSVAPDTPRDELVSILHWLAAIERDKPAGKRDEKGFAEAFAAFRRWTPDDPREDSVKRKEAEDALRKLLPSPR